MPRSTKKALLESNKASMKSSRNNSMQKLVGVNMLLDGNRSVSPGVVCTDAAHTHNANHMKATQFFQLNEDYKNS